MNRLVSQTIVLLTLFTAGCGVPLSDAEDCTDREPDECGSDCKLITANEFLPEEGCWSDRRPFECQPAGFPCGNSVSAFLTTDGTCVIVGDSCTSRSLSLDKECSARLENEPSCSGASFP